MHGVGNGFAEGLPNEPEAPCEDLGFRLHPSIQILGQDPATLHDLVWIGVWSFVGIGLVDHGEFHPGLATGRKFCDFGQLGCAQQIEFFTQLALGSDEIALPWVNVSRCRAVPFAGGSILIERPALQVDLTGCIEEQDVNGTVQQSFLVNDSALFSANDLVLGVDDGKKFFGDLDWVVIHV